MFENKKFILFLKECIAQERDVVAITLLDTKGSSYQKIGATMFVDDCGRSIGVVSAGCFEEKMLQCTKEVLASRKGKYVVHDLRIDSDTIECWTQSIGCDGLLKFWLEPFYFDLNYSALGIAFNSALKKEKITIMRSIENTGSYTITSDASSNTWFNEQEKYFKQKISSPYRLLIFGAGPGCDPLVSIADTLGWLTIVADTRPHLLKSVLKADTLHYLDSAEDAHNLLLENKFDAVVIMSHVFNDDKTYIESALLSDVQYIGVLGSKKRTTMLIQALIQNTDRSLDSRLHYPVGLDLGGSSPESIALAICAEIEIKRNNRSSISAH
ncbi:XdhC/CoxI family protein [Sulfuricurvum sp.]|uniref:XdhC family protein n=1 Tax=Sulfuricurvum sp. TaxID=2025608 RepID=UPI0026035941|nr:XdhC/CoxI family protein [Sulfuricurvum sp.]MDD2267316.1 XdhC family protein [Sulfuricurvum sp.]MDD2783938.1 XdhC family protein [Sulfuricurvum sp.]